LIGTMETSQKAASRWLVSAIGKRDLASVWTDTDEGCRRQWVTDHCLSLPDSDLTPAQEREYLATRVPALAADDGPQHERWFTFQMWQTRELRKLMPELEMWQQKGEVLVEGDREVIAYAREQHGVTQVVCVRMLRSASGWKLDAITEPVALVETDFSPN
jgi:hypothetical protein